MQMEQARLRRWQACKWVVGLCNRTEWAQRKSYGGVRQSVVLGCGDKRARVVTMTEEHLRLALRSREGQSRDLGPNTFQFFFSLCTHPTRRSRARTNPVPGHEPCQIWGHPLFDISLHAASRSGCRLRPCAYCILHTAYCKYLYLHVDG